LTLADVALLKLGRHFRLDNVKIIVGRNKYENKALLAMAKSRGIPCLEVVDYPGPVTLFLGEEEPDAIRKAAAVTVRYSDSPKGTTVKVMFEGRRKSTREAKAMDEQELQNLRV